ncbi:hypothetical protein LO772_31835 [Yinghuangia sp. ASG 101]|uniref:hypothetical protein n=1 Tax=Yinghuangia sp. ASG 101 TaxID=2896848 RepID=UPI001E50026D|nr:hypothetical protein [Yinghuangia sp. ASG 101]UGQ11337.1 hypothetical protein LO772_31835 [Yinghuangia sp. ASG 101]
MAIGTARRHQDRLAAALSRFGISPEPRRGVRDITTRAAGRGVPNTLTASPQ